MVDTNLDTNITFVVPSSDELEVKDNVECPYNECNQVFKSTASRSMHILRHHEGISIPSKSSHHVNRLYFCPVSNCSRNKESGKPFKKLGQVKQHYNLVHKEKEHVCEKCRKTFSLKSALKRHVKECGNTFACRCSVEFKSYNALYQHCKRSGHLPLKEFKNNNPGQWQPRTQQHSQPLIIAPLIIKSVLPLPAISTSSSVCDDEPEATSHSVELATQTDYIGEYLTTTSHAQSTLLQDDKVTQTNPLALCEFGTQTPSPFLSDTWPNPHPYSPNDIDEILETIDFGTQTMDDSRVVFDNLGNYKDQSSQT